MSPARWLGLPEMYQKPSDNALQRSVPEGSGASQPGEPGIVDSEFPTDRIGVFT